jgi:hypothetical protein
MTISQINHRGHRMLGELLSAYTQRQLCTIAEHDARPSWPRGTAEPAQLALDTTVIPSHRLFQKWGDPPSLKLDPFCSSTRTLKHPLTPNFNDGRWANWTYQAPGGTPKTYVRATEPGALISFAVPVRGGLGRVRVQYLQSATFELGIVKCWLDDDKAHAKLVDGFWEYQVYVCSSMSFSTTDAGSIGTLLLWLSFRPQLPKVTTLFGVSSLATPIHRKVVLNSDLSALMRHDPPSHRIGQSCFVLWR